MRIVFFSAARQVWGAEVSLLTLAAALAERKIDMGLVCPAGELADRAGAAGIGRVYRVEPRSASFPSRRPGSDGRPSPAGRPQECARLWARYLRVARRGDRLVIFSYYLLLFAPLARLALRARGVRVVLDLHDHLTSAKARWAVRAGSRATDTVIACSRFTAEQVPRHPDVHHLHRPVAVTAPHRNPLDVTPARDKSMLRVGIIGRITREKRHHLLIEAVRKVGERAELVVRGAADGFSGHHAGEVFARGRALLGRRFVAEGRVSPERAMDDLDVVVVGNPHEPMGRTVLEAQAHGVVAVVPESGGAQELVEHGVTGLTYAPDDPDDLARALDRVAFDAALAARLAAAAIGRVPRPDRYADAYLRLLG